MLVSVWTWRFESSSGHHISPKNRCFSFDVLTLKDCPVSHITHTLIRNGCYYYNRRVPKGAVSNYGNSVRLRIGTDPDQAKHIAGRLTEALNHSFHLGSKLDLDLLLGAIKPQQMSLTAMAEEYIELKAIHPKPTRLAVRLLMSISGNKDVSEYTRDDARSFVRALEQSGAATTTIRRRINSISAVLNYAYAEQDIDKRNPFSRIIIRGEGRDQKKRGTFTLDQLREGYEEALASKSDVRLLFPILGETGCRLGEIVGLRLEDVDLKLGAIYIRPHRHRRLKTAGSERDLPLLGFAERAMTEALRGSDGIYVFPRYYRPDGFVATHASNALNKWIKSRFGGLTAHCLRHTMRDRLRAVEAPMELIDQIGGWSSINTMGSKYGRGYGLEQLQSWMSLIAI